VPTISIDDKETIWVEKYRPKKISDLALPEKMKNDLNEWIKNNKIPNLLLTSKSPGLGKSSLSNVIIHETGSEALFINASLESNIDTLRSKILNFASTSAFDGRPKIVVLDEADYLNQNSTQPALRGFIEEFSKNCRFILTANYKDKILKPIRDRLVDFDFDEIFNTNKELIKDMYIIAKQVLENENIKFKDEDLKFIVKHYYPGMRSIIMKLQKFSASGKLIVNRDDIDSEGLIDNIVSSILEKNFDSMRKFISQLHDPSILYTILYDRIDEFPKTVHPPIIITIAKYQANDALVRDRIVNLAACLTEIMQQL